MVDRSELQRMARTIDAHRKQLDDLHTQIDRVAKVIDEHAVTTGILSHLQTERSRRSSSNDFAAVVQFWNSLSKSFVKFCFVSHGF